MSNKIKLSAGNTLSTGILTLTLMGMTACANTSKAMDIKSAVIPQKLYGKKTAKVNAPGSNNQLSPARVGDNRMTIAETLKKKMFSAYKKSIVASTGWRQ